MQIDVPQEDEGQGTPDDPGEAGPVDVAYRENVDTGSTDEVSLPLVVVDGVFMSPWASIHSSPSARRRR